MATWRNDLSSLLLPFLFTTLNGLPFFLSEAKSNADVISIVLVVKAVLVLVRGLLDPRSTGKDVIWLKGFLLYSQKKTRQPEKLDLTLFWLLVIPTTLQNENAIVPIAGADTQDE